MRPTLYRLGLVAIIALAAFGILALESGADDANVYAPVASVKNVMNAINHEEHGFYGMMKTWAEGNPARGDAQWGIMLDRVMLMAEAGNILAQMDPPKGERGSWVQKAQAFSEACKALKRSCALKKGEDFVAGLVEVRKRCDECHTAHRPE